MMDAVQILGAEARSRVPDEYVMQHPTSANPPTLFLVLAQMASQIATALPSTAETLHQEQFLQAGMHTCMPDRPACSHLMQRLPRGNSSTHALTAQDLKQAAAPAGESLHTLL